MSTWSLLLLPPLYFVWMLVRGVLHHRELVRLRQQVKAGCPRCGYPAAAGTEASP
jgi:hypothetical protein